MVYATTPHERRNVDSTSTESHPRRPAWNSPHEGDRRPELAEHAQPCMALTIKPCRTNHQRLEQQTYRHRFNGIVIITITWMMAKLGLRRVTSR
jgi:hypothetical protein